MAETREFQADIHELLNLIIHSFYSNRDIFIRELVSNASDALEKQRYVDIQRSHLDETYEIRMDALTETGVLRIYDNGIGMTEQDVISKLSTIAKSGTKELLNQWNKESTVDLIGQFGVGFYSAFLVAEKVEVLTRSEGQDYYRWISTADSYYTLEQVKDFEILETDHMEHGTLLRLFIKEDCQEYLQETTLRKVLHQYSSFIRYPIFLHVEKEREIETQRDDVEEEEEAVEVVETQKEKETYREWERMNENEPIWYRPSSDNTKEQYEALYKSMTGNWEPPLFWRQFQTEGKYEFRGILYIPSRAPFDMMGKYQEKRKIQVYVKRVLILSDLERDMLPDWMGFITGVIDSTDLPLNASREMLQQTSIVRAMKSQLKKQVLTMLSELYTHEDLYLKFYTEFHKNLKLGIHEGDETLLSYLRISNSKDEKKISFEEYVQHYRKGEDQNSIYFLTTDKAAHLTTLGNVYIKRGYTLLFFIDPIDEFMLQRISKYKEYDLVNIDKDHVVPWEEAPPTTPETTENTPQIDFCQWIHERLKDPDLESVRFSSKVTDATEDPGLLFASKWGWTGSMETIMKAQPLQDTQTMSFMKGKRILELNAHHPYIQRLQSLYDADKSQDPPHLPLFYHGCLISAGYPIEKKFDVSTSIFRALSAL